MILQNWINFDQMNQWNGVIIIWPPQWEVTWNPNSSRLRKKNCPSLHSRLQVSADVPRVSREERLCNSQMIETYEPGLMKMRINSTPNKNKLVVLICKSWLWWRAYDGHVFGVHIIMQFSHAYDTKFVGVHMIRIYPTTLILPIAYHMHGKVNFCI